MILHTHGWKADRDRAKLLNIYRSLCLHFWVKMLPDYELAKLSIVQLHRLTHDTYAKQKPKEIRWYEQKIMTRPRTDEFKWRWFWRDLFHPPKVKRLVVPIEQKQTGIPFVSA